MVVRDATLDAGVIFDYKTGGGLLRLEGAAPVVRSNLLRCSAGNSIPAAGTGAVEFEVPAAGYSTAPVKVTGTAVGGPADTAGMAPFSIRVSRSSPALSSTRLGAIPLVSAPNGVTPGRVAMVSANRCAFLLGENAAAPWGWEKAEEWDAGETPHAVGVEIDPPGGFILLVR